MTAIAGFEEKNYKSYRDGKKLQGQTMGQCQTLQGRTTESKN